MVNLQKYKQTLRQVPGLRRAYQFSKKIWKKFNQVKLPEKSLANTKEDFIRLAKRDLQTFLLGQRVISFSSANQYDLSIVIPVYNKAEFTFRCLRNLAEVKDLKLQIIIVNNASEDTTNDLLSKVENIVVINNLENLHFLKASNQGAQRASSKYVLFLNNDAEPQTDALKNALAKIKSDPKIAAVGAKLILPDGKLQEAGCLIWSDGCCQGYGRGGSVDQAEAQYEKVVDYCSGAFLLTSKEILEEVNYFDERFAPAYYEEVDFCLTLQSLGYKIVYLPTAEVNHFEFASAGMSNAIDLMNRNRLILLDKHQQLLSTKLDRETPAFLSRSLETRPKVLYIDELLPQIKMGAGYPRANSLVQTIDQLGFFVTVYPLLRADYAESWSEVYQEFPRAVEILIKDNYGISGLVRTLTERANYYDYVWISRPSTMTEIRKLSPNLEIFSGAKIIYDAEALFTLRDIAYGKISNAPLNEKDIEQKMSAELKLSQGVDAVSSVSLAEASYFKQTGIKQVEVLGFQHQLTTSTPSFNDRNGLLFLGALHDDFGPNSDSLIWFIEKVLPILKDKGFTAPLKIIGTNKSPRIQSIKDPQVINIGAVDDLSPSINQAKIFIAPTRFAAGIPQKVTEVASYGLPVIVSELIHQQLGWQVESEYLLGLTPEEFANQVIRLDQDEALWTQLHKNSLARIEQDFSKEAFTNTIKKLLTK